jgi:putative NADPH-quinone reductase
MEKKILLILGHPSESSFCYALLNAYKLGAEEAGAICKTIYINRIKFDVNLSDGYKTGNEIKMEDDLVFSQQLIKWADHIVMVYPNWWGFMPAISKGFIDRVLMPGFAFKHQSGKIFPDKLLKGKSIRLLVTMDTPKWWFYIIHRAAQYKILKDTIFGYVGFDPIRFSTFGYIRKSTGKQRNIWIKKVQNLGTQFK